jgi:hypothetical protein
MTTIQQGFPTIQTPLVLPDGSINPVWWNFLISIYQRTGGTTGDSGGTSLPPVILTPTGSPFLYSPPVSGTVFMSGGGITKVTLSRAGASAAVGNFRSGIRMANTDTVEVWFVEPPHMVFFSS